MRNLFKLFNVVALLVLLLSCAATYIDPQRAWQFSFAGFAFPVVLIINVAFLVLWILKRDAFRLMPLFALILAWPFVTNSFALHFSEKNVEQGLKILTWNVKSFDLYNWSKNESTRNRMMSLLKEENADVVCLQEFYTNNQLFLNLELIRDTLGYPYVYFSPAVDLRKLPTSKLQKTLWRSGVLHQMWGVATFSRYPIVDSGLINFSNSLTNSCAYADIDFGNNTVRVYNVHYQSLHLGYEDYAALDSLQENKTAGLSWLKSIGRKMKRAYTKRAAQANAVKQNMNGTNLPKIVAGDFNDVPISYTYQTTAGEMNDAFEEKGKGFGATYINPLSVFRIDYLLLDQQIKINSYKSVRVKLSDHYPVVSTFSF